MMFVEDTRDILEIWRKRRSDMKNTSIKLRAFNIGGAFELALPNGKVILIDPCFSYPKPDKTYSSVFQGGYTREDVTGADYIILTHSHWDHDIDIGYFVEKFNARVFCSVTCAEEILKYHKIPYDNLVPVFPNSKYTLEDYVLEIFQGKHNPQGGRKYEEECRLANAIGVTDHSRCDQLGNLDSIDFMITTNNHFSVLMTGGMVVWQDIFDICKQKAPNLLLRQAGVRKNGEQVSPKELAELLIRYHAQIVLPFHHEVIVNKYGKDWTDDYFSQVAEYISQVEPGMVFVNPEEWKWYNIGIDVSID